MKITDYYKKYSFTAGTDFTAIITTPKNNDSNHPEHKNQNPHRSH